MDTTPSAQSKKRDAPDTGHSPVDLPRKLLGLQTAVLTNDDVNVTRHDSSQATNRLNDQSTQGGNGSTNRSQRYSFIIECKNDIDLPKLDEVVGSTLEKTSKILFSKLTKNKKAVLYKTKSSHGDPARDFNYLTRDENIQNIKTKYGDESIVVLHHDSTKKADEKEPAHAVAKFVPVQYSEEEFLRQIIAHNPELNNKVLKVVRMKYKSNGDPTFNMRIICSDKQTSMFLVQNGLKINCRFFKCEKARYTPRPKQCYKCQKLDGHMSGECPNSQHCAKCGESHKTKDCRRSKDEYVCINCGNAHAAWSDRCINIKQATEEMKRREEEKKKANPTSQPVTNRTMSGYVHTVQTGQEKTQQEVTNKVEELKKSNNDQVKRAKEEIERNLEERFDEIKNMLLNLNKRLDKAEEASAGPSSAPSKSAETSYSKLCSKIDSMQRKVDLVEAKMSTTPTTIRDEVETMVKKELSDNKNKIHKRITDCEKEIQSTKHIIEEKLQEIVNVTTEKLADFDKIEDIFRDQLDIALGKRRVASVDSIRRRIPKSKAAEFGTNSKDGDILAPAKLSLPTTSTKIPGSRGKNGGT